MNEHEKQITTVRAIERAFDILGTFSHEKQEQALAEISQQVKLAKSTVHRILTTMQQYHLIEQDKDTGKYKLGYKLITLGGIALEGIDIRKKALKEMKWLVEQSGETSNLYVIRDGKRICVEQVPGKQMIKRYAGIGDTYPLYCGAAGKLLLAYFSQEQLEEYLQKNTLEPLTPYSIVDEQQLREEMRRIKEQGYATSANEREMGAASVAAPIFNHQGQVLGCITISGPDTRFTRENVASFVQLVLEAGARISRELGYVK